MSKILAGFYNNSDIDITLVKYDSNDNPPPSVTNFVQKGAYFVPDQPPYNIPDCYPVNKWFSGHHIEICAGSSSTALLSFWEEDNPDSVSNLYYCTGKTPPDNPPQITGTFSGNYVPVYFVFTGSSGNYQIAAYQNQTFALDVAYKSDVEPCKAAKLGHPIAMAYGFVLIGQSDAEIGEKVDLNIDPGDTVVFSIFDIADNASPVSQLQITCNDVTNPQNPVKGVSPFGWSNGTITINDVQLSSSKGESTGCNMKAFGYSTPAYTAQAAAAGKTFDITITVILINGKVFQVDPEMDVMSS